MLLRIDRFEGDGLQAIWIAFAVVDGVQHSHGQCAADILRIDGVGKKTVFCSSIQASSQTRPMRVTVSQSKWSGAASIARLPLRKDRREHTHLSVPDACTRLPGMGKF